PAVVRQADRPQLGALTGVRLGSRLGGAPAAAAGRGGRAHPGAVRRGVRAAHRHHLLMRRFGGRVEFACDRETAFDYLVDPRRRPEWQSSLRRVSEVDGEPRVGQTWVDETKPGLKPRMRTTELVRPARWAEEGTWRFVRAEL